MIPEVGQRLGPYEILGKLGGGGMGVLFRAWDERLHREVAVKLLHDDYKMPQMRERFLQEARAASRLNHPNICTVFDIGEQEGSLYLVMELLEGETLKDRIARGAIPVEEIVRYGKEIATALAVAHAKGIVHRDVKPANIFLVKMPNGGSQAKVLDFGLAQIGLEVRGGWESRTLDLTLEGATVGTVAYMSPEQARGESLDARSDLFSLGIVMYEMATRQVPFKGATSALVFVELFNHVPDSVRMWNESVPRELERVILKLLSKDRKGRFQTAKELYDSLEDIAVKLNKGGWLNRGAAAAVPLVHAPDPVARHKRHRPLTVGVQGESGGASSEASVPAVPVSCAENMMVRPVQSTESGLDETELRPGVPSTLLWDNDKGKPQLYLRSNVPPQSDSSAAAADARAAKRAADALAEKLALGRELALARSWSGMTQVEYGWDDVGSQDTPEEKLGGHRESIGAVESKGFAQSGIRMTLAAVLIVLVASGMFLILRNGLFRPMVLGPKDRLLLTVIQNKTGDETLDGTVMQGLEIALRQSPSLNMLGGDAYQAGLQQIKTESGGVAAVSVQRVAEKVQARAYVYGEIRGLEAPYTINVDVLRTGTNDKVASLEEIARDRSQISAAIGRLAEHLGAEVAPGVLRKAVPLEQESTANVNALHAFAVGEASRQSGQTGKALEAYREAVRIDPKFVQAQMQLAWLYRAEKAEVTSANAAEMARAAAVHVSEKTRLMAQFCYEMNASGDYGQATETMHRYVAKYPLDVEGMKGMARVLRLQGYLPEALDMAQRGYGANPFDAEAYEEAELALVGMDRFGAALQLQSEAQRMGVQHDGKQLALGYLQRENDAIATEGNVTQRDAVKDSSISYTEMTYKELNARGLYLDNEGRMAEGEELWRTAAASAGQLPELVSTQAYMLAQGALDRALAENCSVALEMISSARNLQKGPVATFNGGMAAALCGDYTYAEKVVIESQGKFPRNTDMIQYYVPELEAAAELGANEPTRALKILMEERPHEQVTFIPYFRGVAHIAVNEMPSAIADFQMVLAHRGLSLLMGGSVYPMAEIGAARAYAANGDNANSVEAYKRFLRLWADADRGQARLVEAVAKSK
jgi:tRNA A-37 threonylcarbamoyl transferase component Bud32/tetratricopeptide (TPR) repeat protein